MAKDDYFVLAYRLLSYLYACLKEGEHPDMEYLRYGTKDFPIGEAYWEYLLSHLLEDGYLEGIQLVPITGRGRIIRLTDRINITPKGIAYLEENSSMKKAAEFLKSIKEIVPGI